MLDCLPHPLAQNHRTHGVQLGAARALVVRAEPGVARVEFLIPHVEGGATRLQVAHILFRQGEAMHHHVGRIDLLAKEVAHVRPAVNGHAFLAQAVEQVLLGHVQPTRVEVADVEEDQWLTEGVGLLCQVVQLGGRAEAVDGAEPDREVAQDRPQRAGYGRFLGPHLDLVGLPLPPVLAVGAHHRLGVGGRVVPLLVLLLQPGFVHDPLPRDAVVLARPGELLAHLVGRVLPHVGDELAIEELVADRADGGGLDLLQDVDAGVDQCQRLGGFAASHQATLRACQRRRSHSTVASW